jgi:hypothetical protein
MVAPHEEAMQDAEGWPAIADHPRAVWRTWRQHRFAVIDLISGGPLVAARAC